MGDFSHVKFFANLQSLNVFSRYYRQSDSRSRCGEMASGGLFAGPDDNQQFNTICI